MKKPCHNCPNRHAECHADCEDYAEFRKECDRIMDIRTKENNADPGISKERLRKMWKEMKH